MGGQALTAVRWFSRHSSDTHGAGSRRIDSAGSSGYTLQGREQTIIRPSAGT